MQLSLASAVSWASLAPQVSRIHASPRRIRVPDQLLSYLIQRYNRPHGGNDAEQPSRFASSTHRMSARHHGRIEIAIVSAACQPYVQMGQP